MQQLQWDRSSAALSAAMACATHDVRFAAGPAAYASGGRVRFFQREPTLPAYHGHQIHGAGHFHQPHRPVRTAYVGRATEPFTLALEARGNYLRVIGRQKRRVERGVFVLMDIACYVTRLVCVSVESVSRTRRICVTHGMERHCHSAGQDTQSVGVAMSPQLSLGQKTNWFRECDEVTGVQVGSGRVFPWGPESHRRGQEGCFCSSATASRSG